MKRILFFLLILAMALVPAASPAESFEELDDFDAFGEIDDFDASEEIDGFDAFGEWTLPDDGGLTWSPSELMIALPEDSATGYAWTAELDDESVLTLALDQTLDAGLEGGALPMRAFTYQPAADGMVLVSLYYETFEDVAAMLSYAVTVEGGEIAHAEYEDLSDWGGEGDEEGGVFYEGETGGVPLYLPDMMTQVSEEQGVVRLESDDGSIWMTIAYDPDGDPDALLQEFEDEAAMREAYADSQLISTAVDMESDPPRGIAVYETLQDGYDTIVEYTGYQAPAGGVLLVHTGYVMQ